MGKNQRLRKLKKETIENSQKIEIKHRQKQKFSSIAIPTGQVFLSILITVMIIFIGKIYINKINEKKDTNIMPTKQIAVIETNKGTIKFQLEQSSAPKTVSNFKKLAEEGYYNNLLWHRVVQDFVIQGGDPKNDGTGGESAEGGTFADEINPWSLGLDQATIDQYISEGYVYSKDLKSMKMNIGSVAMANSGPNTNGSQFFIVTTKEQPHLNGKHTVFGQVIEGMDVVQKIEQGDKMIKVYIENNAS